MSRRLTYVDLFAGCGGLSLGLEQAGFSLELAVEKSSMAAETFHHNLIGRLSSSQQWLEFCNPDMGMLERAKSKLVVSELEAVLACRELIKDLRERKLDLVAGGPPCQGFSLAGRRNPDDVRNRLPWQFLQFVSEVQPRAVVIENVSGMRHRFGSLGSESPFHQLRRALENTDPGYVVQPMELNAMHFGVPQHRPRVMLVGIREDVAKQRSLSAQMETWRSEYEFYSRSHGVERPDLAPKGTHFGEGVLTVGDAIRDLVMSPRNNVCPSEFARDMREDVAWLPALSKGGTPAECLANHVVRNHNERVTKRFRIYQYMFANGIPASVLGIPKQDELTRKQQRRLVCRELKGALLPAKAPDETVLAETIDDLSDLVMSLGTKKHSQRPLSWTMPSPTIVSLPDDFVHPDEPRTLTVRELARIQSFPDAFVFRSKETTGSFRRRVEVPQYTQVGNAVPPRMAKAVGAALRRVLEG
jgi:DNA (cytosine-5)-methyltransferase 1